MRGRQAKKPGPGQSGTDSFSNPKQYRQIQKLEVVHTARSRKRVERVTSSEEGLRMLISIEEALGNEESPGGYDYRSK